MVADDGGVVKPQAISLPDNAKSLTLFSFQCMTYMALDPQDLSLPRRRFFLMDAASSPGLGAVVIPAPKGTNNQVWFLADPAGAAPGATLSVVVNCG